MVIRRHGSDTAVDQGALPKNFGDDNLAVRDRLASRVEKAARRLRIVARSASVVPCGCRRPELEHELNGLAKREAQDHRRAVEAAGWSALELPATIASLTP